jgi:hypothetical protein
MRLFETIVLWISGLSLLAFGVAFEIAPLKTMAAAGIELTGPIAAAELRAFYGGVEVALGALIIAWMLDDARRREALVLSAVLFACVGLSRLAGMVIEGADSAFLRFALATELGLAAACGFVLAKR